MATLSVVVVSFIIMPFLFYSVLKQSRKKEVHDLKAHPV